MIKKNNMSCIGTTINIYYNKLQKKLGKKYMQSFSKVIMLAHSVLFAPIWKPLFLYGWSLPSSSNF